MVKVLFLHIPKTGGVTIQDGLQKSNALKKNLGHKLAKNIISEYGDDIILTVVRNPYDRLFSVFEFYQKKERHPSLHISDNVTFEEFILSFEKEYYRKKSPHFTCCEYITDNSGNILVTDFLRFENLDEDYKFFCVKYNIPEFKLEKKNVNPFKNEKIDKETLYTPTMRKIVERIFRNDLDTFDYSYEGWINK